MRFKSIWTKELADAEVPICVEAEVANRAVDAVPLDPNVRVSEPVEPAAADAAGGQPVAMEVKTTNEQTGTRKLVRNPVVERAGEAAPQPQPIEVSLEQRVTTGATKRAAETQLTPNSVGGFFGGLRSFDGQQDVQTNVMSAIGTTNEDPAAETIDEDSRQYDYYTGKLLDRTKYMGRKKELDQLESLGVIRRVKKSEANDSTHVRIKIITHYQGDLVGWRLVSMVNQYERHDVFAGTPTLKVLRMLIAKVASHSHTEHGHRKIVAIMELAVALFHADMEGVIHAHPPAEAEPDRTVVWLLIKAHYGTRKAAR